MLWKSLLKLLKVYPNPTQHTVKAMAKMWWRRKRLVLERNELNSLIRLGNGLGKTLRSKQATSLPHPKVVLNNLGILDLSLLIYKVAF